MATEIRVPTLGESVTEATVATWFKKPGETVLLDEMLCELETDKVTVEVPSPAEGRLQEIIVAEGETVNVDALLAILEKGTFLEPNDKKIMKPENEESVDSIKDIENAPSAKKIMSEKNLDPKKIIGSGRDGRIMKEDVQTLSPMIKVAKAIENNSNNSQIENEDGHEERVKMSRLRQTISSRLKEAQNTAAILTTYNEVDMSEIKKIRTDYKDLFIQKHGISLGFMSFFVKACSHALLEIPEVNAEINNDEIIYKNYVNMGVAVGTPNGLVVPVVKNTHKLSFAEIEKEISRLGKKGNDGKLTMDEMQGGTFTISNGGVYGSLMSAPILNPPQSGIFGMHKIQDRPIVVEGAIVARPMMYIALSYDHRLIDGKGAVTFLVRVKEALEDPRRLLMDL
ncbi:MAG: 2-oxoglutarate dehydrogenase complex dihydrolipoyllysine-residue succinyltransferase [Paracoccaceae bacterium]|jgi:2-oxoglutarate dehydrogenase E2 component (dihydrolipoamide succinyltransferase)|nr:2-oxoglutarate dehydrogenase complex dihydrolipoyllysine-residue succinyltransferase [Paracoccaceae bacterium]|tara:strand:- start:1417 stop:2607 length:1191 start_codon:yes stop_codon:yes gene_type:complete